MAKRKAYTADELRPAGDPSLQIGYDYYDLIKSVSKRPNAKVEVYTPVELASFSVRSTIEQLYEKTIPNEPELLENPKKIKCLDPSCGGGIFLILLIRELSKSFGLTKKEVAENCIYGIDIDLGAINTTKRSIYKEVGERCKTNIVWGDCLADLYIQSEKYEHITDIEEIDRHNVAFQRLLTDYLKYQNSRKEAFHTTAEDIVFWLEHPRSNTVDEYL